MDSAGTSSNLLVDEQTSSSTNPAFIIDGSIVDDDEDDTTLLNATSNADIKPGTSTTTEQNRSVANNGQLTCYHQRSALLKSILNFFKKVISDSSNSNVPNLGDSVRHMMDGSLPNSLKHIISNADYYGPSLFLLATDVVQLFIFQEPSQLSQLQENGLTDVILFALLKKNVPATREVLGSLPTVFSALCLNTAGLNAFIESKPFDKLFQVLLSPDYLPAMRRRRNAAEQMATNLNSSAAAAAAAAASSSSGTASQLGSAMDELMRHQPSLRIEAMNSIIKLLQQLIEMGKNPNYICMRQSSSSSSAYSSKTMPTVSASTMRSNQSTSVSMQTIDQAGLATAPTTVPGTNTTGNVAGSSSTSGDNATSNTAASGTNENQQGQQTNSDDEEEENNGAAMMIDR